jgi:hypothetical protein
MSTPSWLGTRSAAWTRSCGNEEWLHLLHLRDDLLKEVARLAEEKRFDYLLIESTGISEPMPVAATFSFDGLPAAASRRHGRQPALHHRCRADRVVQRTGGGVSSRWSDSTINVRCHQMVQSQKTLRCLLGHHHAKASLNSDRISALRLETSAPRQLSITAQTFIDAT